MLRGAGGDKDLRLDRSGDAERRGEECAGRMGECASSFCLGEYDGEWGDRGEHVLHEEG